MLKLGGVFTLLFAVCIALIRAQPYDDSELRAFLTPPEGCPAPCFMGIRPGVTTMEEAVAILKAHEWVTNYEYSGGGNFLYWNLSDKAPIPNFPLPGTLSENYVSFRDNTVQRIALPLALSVGEALLLFGLPSNVYYADLRDAHSFTYITEYPEYHLLVTAFFYNCGFNRGMFWRRPTTVYIGGDIDYWSGDDYQPVRLDLMSWLDWLPEMNICI